jgi:hypothetical protein
MVAHGLHGEEEVAIMCAESPDQMLDYLVLAVAERGGELARGGGWASRAGGIATADVAAKTVPPAATLSTGREISSRLISDPSTTNPALMARGIYVLHYCHEQAGDGWMPALPASTRLGRSSSGTRWPRTPRERPPSAPKHGITPEDATQAASWPIWIEDLDDDSPARQLRLGFDTRPVGRAGADDPHAVRADLIRGLRRADAVCVDGASAAAASARRPE